MLVIVGLEPIILDPCVKHKDGNINDRKRVNRTINVLVQVGGHKSHPYEVCVISVGAGLVPVHDHYAKNLILSSDFIFLWLR